MKTVTRWLFFTTLIAALGGVSLIYAQDDAKFAARWEKLDYAKHKVSLKELQPLDLDNLQKIRGIVFGKRGRIFKEETIQNYLAARPWYKPNPNFKNSVLTATERANIDLIRQAEAEKHDFVQPGDLRFWQNKLIPEDKIAAATAAEWRIMLAEIEAVHGKNFVDEPWLQKYFEERYWYKSNPKYTPNLLTAIEKQNLEAITKRRNQERQVAVSFGDMDKFQDVLLEEKLLEGVTLGDLRLLRNEFWARRGRKFTVAGIQQFFAWQDWYKPAKDQSKVKLNDIETQNVATILLTENRLREEIAAKPKTVDDFAGLFTEDLRLLRNEIYAKHGRIFKTKHLNDYFKAQTWYKPNPDYTDALLSAIESANLKVIKEAEESAISKFKLQEG